MVADPSEAGDVRTALVEPLMDIPFESAIPVPCDRAGGM